MKILIKQIMANNPDTGSRAPFRTAAAALGLLLAACADGPTANADDQRAEVIPVAATVDVQAQIDTCLSNAIKEAKEEFGMSDTEIAAELDFLKSDCAVLVDSDQRVQLAQASIDQSQARIDAANARQQELAEQAVRDAEGRSQ